MSLDTAGLLLRLVLGLAAVLALMWLAARVLRGAGGGRAAGALELVARQQVGRGAAVAVVRVVDRAVVLGITDNQVSLLTETELAAVEAASEAARPGRARRADRRKSAAQAAAAEPGRQHVLEGSILAGSTWRQAIEAIRERTVRR